MKIVFDFPREVMELSTEKGKGFRKLVRSNQDLERYWAGKNGVSNAFMTVYGYRGLQQPYNKRVDLMTPIVRHFVMDFDPKNFRQRDRPDVETEVALEQTLKLHYFLIDKEISHAVWYSGGGFHIWPHAGKPRPPIREGCLQTLIPGKRATASLLMTIGFRATDSSWGSAPRHKESLDVSVTPGVIPLPEIYGRSP